MSTTSEDAATLPLSVPSLRGREWDYVRECLETGWVSSAGPFVERFEQMVAEYVGAKHAVAVVNGTSALHIALLCSGVLPDDEVLVPSLTFIASANSIRYAGAHPVFVDAEPQYWQMDPNLIEHFLTCECERKDGVLRNRLTGRAVRAIMPVHILGHPVQIEAILDLAGRFELHVVEDAAEGMGTRKKGRHVGSFGHVGCFSFNGNKIMTTGGGGMLVTDDEATARRARYLTTQAKDDPLEYIHNEVGYNYRLTNIAAAIGCAQLEQLDRFVAAKRRTAAAYLQGLEQVPGIQHFTPAPDAFCTYWLYTVRVLAESYGIDRRELCRKLAQRGIQSRPLWQPLHASEAYLGSPSVLRGVADRLYDECLSLPCSAEISDTDVTRVCREIVESSAADTEHFSPPVAA